MTFQQQIQQGIPSELPQPKPYETAINHAPKRKEILNEEEKKLDDKVLENIKQQIDKWFIYKK